VSESGEERKKRFFFRKLEKNYSLLFPSPYLRVRVEHVEVDAGEVGCEHPVDGVAAAAADADDLRSGGGGWRWRRGGGSYEKEKERLVRSESVERESRIFEKSKRSPNFFFLRGKTHHSGSPLSASPLSLFPRAMSSPRRYLSLITERKNGKRLETDEKRTLMAENKKQDQHDDADFSKRSRANECSTSTLSPRSLSLP